MREILNHAQYLEIKTERVKENKAKVCVCEREIKRRRGE